MGFPMETAPPPVVRVEDAVVVAPGLGVGMRYQECSPENAKMNTSHAPVNFLGPARSLTRRWPKLLYKTCSMAAGLVMEDLGSAANFEKDGPCPDGTAANSNEKEVTA